MKHLPFEHSFCLHCWVCPILERIKRCFGKKCLRFHHKIVDISIQHIHINISPCFVVWTCLDHMSLPDYFGSLQHDPPKNTYPNFNPKNNPQNLQLTRAPTTSLGPQFRMTLGNRLESSAACTSLCSAWWSTWLHWRNSEYLAATTWQVQWGIP